MMAAEEFADSIADQVNSLGVEQLLELCTQFNVVVPDLKKDKRGAVMRLFTKFVDQQLEDDNDDVLGRMDGEIGKMLKSKMVKKEAPDEKGGEVKKEETEDRGGETSTTKVSTTTDNLLRGVKFREFKVDGSVGRAAGCIDWQNLQFQIKKGKTAGHGPEEIMNGVIKAMKVGSSLHKYYQNNIDDMSWDDFFDMLESHYISKTQESSTIFTNMGTSSQEPEEEAGDFAFRMLEMSKMVIKLGEKEEDSTWDPNFVRKKCLQSLSLGFIEPSIRADLREFLKDHTKKDRAIIDEVGKAEKRSSELKKKMKGKGGANSMALYGDYNNNSSQDNRNVKNNGGGNFPKTPTVDPVLTAVQKLTEKVDDIGKIATRVDALEVGLANVQEQLAGITANQNTPNIHPSLRQPPVIPAVGGRRGIKCQTCENNRVVFCRHCNKCGEDGHKRKDCPN